MAVTIPDAYAVPLVLFSLTGLVSLIAYLFRQGSEQARLLAITAAELAAFRKDVDRRLERLEGWRDGVQFAASAAQATQAIAQHERREEGRS